MPVGARSRCIVACILLPPSLSTLAAGDARAADRKRACVAASTEGQTLGQDDKLLEARDELRICASERCPAVMRSYCTRWLADLEARIPTVIVRAQDGSGADVLDAQATIDGKPVEIGRPAAVDPGEHDVTVARPDGTHEQRKILVVDGDERVVVVRMSQPTAARPQPPAPHAQPSTVRAEPAASGHGANGGIPTGAWVLGGFGVAALGTSGYFALATWNEIDQLRSQCHSSCTPQQEQTGRTYAAVTYVSLGIGAAALVGAVTWALLSSSKGTGRSGAAWAPIVEVHPVAGGFVTGVAARY